MDKRVQQMKTSLSSFKSKVVHDLQQGVPTNDIIAMIEKTELQEEPRRRNKNTVPLEERCIAKSAKNDQCTRRRKAGHTCCGTHSKGVPHGFISADTKPVHREVWAEDINGIIYYIDIHHNVYKTEDIMKNNVNPSILATWSKTESGYTIHWC